MKLYTILLLVLAFIVVAFLLGLRDKKMAEKLLLKKFKDNYGKAPARNYRADDLDHVGGYYKNHHDPSQIDDITWNDLNMDGVFKRLNYCLSAAGEEYLYYMLRTPKQADDFKSFEDQVNFFRNNDEERRKFQLLFRNIGNNRRYSIYDYLDYLEKFGETGNRKQYLALVLMAAAIGLCFVNFAIGFITLAALMVFQIITYFKIKGEIDPYLVTYSYIIRILGSVNSFTGIKEEVFAKDVEELKLAAKEFSSFRFGAQFLLAPGAVTSGNPVDLVMDYVRMVTHIDIIKFNQMFRIIMTKKEHLDKILEITGRIEAEISVACFRASFEGKFTIPEFGNTSYEGKDLFHPLIEEAVPNDITTDRGVLLTGSNASGKSTFLKTCAINAILAQSIHTVLGTGYKAGIYRIFSSMALKDDIFQGESYYIVEIKSIKRILDAAADGGGKVLCFVDEVLRGTNTVERIAASTQILKKLYRDNVQCFAATHDIELTSLLKDEYDIYHFEGDVSDNDVRFDYKLKSGPATTRNAIQLLKVLGYEDRIVEDAQKMADGFLEKGSWELG